MTTQESSLEYILPHLQTLSPAQFIRHQVTTLQQIVADILFEIERRKNLEDRLLSGLEERVMHLRSELMNIQPSYNFNPLERKIALEHDLESISIQKVHSQEKTATDIFEMKKLLWHYWLMLHQKEAQRYFLK